RPLGRRPARGGGAAPPRRPAGARRRRVEGGGRARLAPALRGPRGDRGFGLGLALRAARRLRRVSAAGTPDRAPAGGAAAAEGAGAPAADPAGDRRAPPVC